MESTAADPLLLYLLANARSAAVREEFLRLPSETYTATRDVKIFTGTYNVNGQLPGPGVDLREWLGGGRHADIVAVALQEAVPLSAANVVLGGGSENAACWDSAIAQTLNGELERSQWQGRAKSDGVELQESMASLALAPPPPADEGSEAGDAVDRHHERFASADGGDSSTLALSPRSSHRFLSPALSSEGSEYLSGDETLDVSIDGDPSIFVQVAARQLVGVYLTIWVKNGFLKNVSGIQTLSVATGMMGYLGNKGAVAARMRVFDTGICFISAHLSSGEAPGDEAKRHYDYQEILRRAFFSDPTTVAGGPIDSSSQDTGHWGTSTHVLSTQHIFWMGDLNYRLRGPIHVRRVVEQIHRGQLGPLLERDQLRAAMASGAAFAGWVEAPIRFAPTFKFKRGTKSYLGVEWPTTAASNNGLGNSTAALSSAAKALNAADSGVLSDNKEAITQYAAAAEATAVGGPPERPRLPAWTDRILYKSRSPGDVRQMTYTMAEGITLSDHRPVSAAYILRAVEYLRHEIDAAIDISRRLVDAKEMAATPHCQLSPSSVSLGTLEYGMAHEVAVTLRNEGQTDAEYHVVPDLMGQRQTPWLQIGPQKGVVPVGGRISLKLTAVVTGGPGGCADTLVASSMPSSLLRGTCPLESILVLRVKGGNDMFLAISGRYRPSWMGLGLLTIAQRAPLPIASAWADSESGEGPAPAMDDAVHDENSEAVEEDVSSALAKTDSLVEGSVYTARAAEDDQEEEAHEYQTKRKPGIPWELMCLLDALSTPEALSTPGIFLLDTQAILPFSPAPDPSVQIVRGLLERGNKSWPEGIGPRELAATLLAALAALPEPLLPEGAKALCDVASYTSASTPGELVRGVLMGPRRELYDRVMALFAMALDNNYTEISGLAPAALAVVLADIFFPPLLEELHAGGEALGVAGASGLHAAAENITAIGMRRIRFVQDLLEDKAGE